MSACGVEASGDTEAPTPWWLADGDGGSQDGGGLDGGGLDGAVVAGDGSGADAGDTSDGGELGEVGDATGDGGAEADSGPQIEHAYYRAELVSRVEVQDPSPFGSSWAVQTTTTDALVHVQWQGKVGKGWLQPCKLSTSPVHGTKTAYNNAFIQAISVEEAKLQREAGSITQQDAIQVVGLEQGYQGAMPGLGDSKHPALRDGDKDGKPGVTVAVEIPLFGAQHIYVAQRSRTSFVATVAADGTVEAEPTVVTEQAVVGASMDILIAAPKTKAPTSGKAETLRWIPLPAPVGCDGAG